MVSMKDIANALNLSRCTVSDILNNKLEHRSYKAETIEMVRMKAKEMGYVSNNICLLYTSSEFPIPDRQSTTRSGW